MLIRSYHNPVDVPANDEQLDVTENGLSDLDYPWIYLIASDEK